MKIASILMLCGRFEGSSKALCFLVKVFTCPLHGNLGQFCVNLTCTREADVVNFNPGGFHVYFSLKQLILHP